MIEDKNSVVFKYKVAPPGLGERFTIDLPVGYQILHFGSGPDGNFSLWCAVDPLEEETVSTDFVLVGTGQSFDEAKCFGFTDHVGTVFSGAFVWHLFRCGILLG